MARSVSRLSSTPTQCWYISVKSDSRRSAKHCTATSRCAAVSGCGAVWGPGRPGSSRLQAVGAVHPRRTDAAQRAAAARKQHLLLQRTAHVTRLPTPHPHTTHPTTPTTPCLSPPALPPSWQRLRPRQTQWALDRWCRPCWARPAPHWAAPRRKQRRRWLHRRHQLHQSQKRQRGCKRGSGRRQRHALSTGTCRPLSTCSDPEPQTRNMKKTRDAAAAWPWLQQRPFKAAAPIATNVAGQPTLVGRLLRHCGTVPAQQHVHQAVHNLQERGRHLLRRLAGCSGRGACMSGARCSGVVVTMTGWPCGTGCSTTQHGRLLASLEAGQPARTNTMAAQPGACVQPFRLSRPGSRAAVCACLSWGARAWRRPAPAPAGWRHQHLALAAQQQPAVPQLPAAASASPRRCPQPARAWPLPLGWPPGWPRRWRRQDRQLAGRRPPRRRRQAAPAQLVPVSS